MYEPTLPVLILIGFAGLGLLLLLIIKFKVQAFYALLLVSIVVGLAAGLPFMTVPETETEPEQLGVIQAIIAGAGGTLGSVALLVALGSMLGKIIEMSGGADSLAGRFTKMLGPKRVGIALLIAASILAIPVFFDAGFIILIPIIYAFSKAAGFSPVKFGLPIAGIMLAIHVAVPPHPGIVGGSEQLGAILAGSRFSRWPSAFRSLHSHTSSGSSSIVVSTPCLRQRRQCSTASVRATAK